MHTFKNKKTPSPPDIKIFDTCGGQKHPLKTSLVFGALDSSQFSRRTVLSWSSSAMLIVAMAPSLNSNEVPPSTTMQASQQRERTHTLRRQRHNSIQNAAILTATLLWQLLFSFGSDTEESPLTCWRSLSADCWRTLC